jgi:hypothetical protein
MATVIGGDARRAMRLAAAHPEALVISVGPARVGTDGSAAQVGVCVEDAALARRLTSAMTRALRAAVAMPPRELVVVEVRSRKAFERLRPTIAGAIAVVPVTARNLRRVGEIVESIRGAEAAGVQLVWDGREPPRETAEARVFAILEEARATLGRPPVVLASGCEPVDALRILIELRLRAATAR